MKSKQKVVFVCTFNYCRSVAAEYLLRKLLLQKDKELSNKVEITSAGIVSKEISELLKLPRLSYITWDNIDLQVNISYIPP